MEAAFIDALYGASTKVPTTATGSYLDEFWNFFGYDNAPKQEAIELQPMSEQLPNITQNEAEVILQTVSDDLQSEEVPFHHSK